MSHHYDDVQPKIRRVIRDVIAHNRRFDHYADLKDEVRRRLAALRLAYTPTDFDSALTRVDAEEHPVDLSRHVRPPSPRGPRSPMQAWAQHYAETTRRGE